MATPIKGKGGVLSTKEEKPVEKRSVLKLLLALLLFIFLLT